MLTVLFYLPVALGSLLYLFWWGGEFALVVRTLGEHPARDLSVGAAVGVTIAAATQLMTRWTGIGQRMAAALGRTVGRRSWLSCLVLACASAVGEELLFRAVLQQRLGMPIATVLFAAAHVPPERDLWPWPVFALPIGVVFGVLFDQTGAVLAPVAAHAALNALNLRFVGHYSSAAPISGGGTGSAR